MKPLITCPACETDFHVDRPLRQMDGSGVICPHCQAHVYIFSEVGKPTVLQAECDQCRELIRGEAVRHKSDTLCGLCADDRQAARMVDGLEVA